MRLVRGELVRAERMVAGGSALARRGDGRIVFVRGALPEEIVTVELTGRRGGTDLARVLEVVEASDHRVEPPCPRRREGCGGCDWQHLAPEQQLPAKVEVVVDALRRTGRLADPVVTAGESVDGRGYRTTVRVVGRGRTHDSDRPTVGFRRERSNETVSASGCLVVHPLLADLLETVRARPEVEVTLRCSAATGERVATWSGAGEYVEGLPTDVRTGPRASITEVVGHRPTAGAPDGTTRLRVSAAAFFQSGPQAAGLLVDAVARAAPELITARRVVDLYGGVGLFAAAVAPPEASVLVVESSRTAAADARHNVLRAEVVVADVSRLTEAPSRSRSVDVPVGVPVDVLVADPPRSGLQRAGVAAIERFAPGTVVLVSCDPVAGARDAALLVAAGYRHRATEVLDLFPGTHHVETVTSFTSGALPA